MGNKAAKQFIRKKNSGKALSADACDEDLADFLATLSDMARKGSAPVDHPLLPSTSAGRQSAPTTPLKDRRSRLQRSEAVHLPEDLSDKLDLTPEQAATLHTMIKKDDHPDWSEMKEWLVWCMNANLREEVETYRRNNVENQSSLESNTET